MDDQKGETPQRPIGPTEARENAQRMAEAGNWPGSIAWSLLAICGQLQAIERSSRGR